MAALIHHHIQYSSLRHRDKSSFAGRKWDPEQAEAEKEDVFLRERTGVGSDKEAQSKRVSPPGHKRHYSC